MSQVLAWLDTKWNTAHNCLKLFSRELRTYVADVLEHLILSVVLYVLLCITLYALIMRWRLRFQRDVRKPSRILIVTAHPDDEAMFFGPTVLRFTQCADNSVYLMCLSTGRNYGMGNTRKRELYASCKVLGIPSENIFVQNHTSLPDAMNANWPAEIIAQTILQHVEMYDIDTLITFDKHGVSRHVNHCSIYYAVAYLSTGRELPERCKVYVLESINLLRKYWFLLDIPICYILSRVRYIATTKQRNQIREAMRQHKSQLVWFRRLYLWFSRYTLINTLQQMDRLDIELDLEVDD